MHRYSSEEQEKQVTTYNKKSHIMTTLELKTTVKKLLLRVLKLESQVRPLVVEDSPSNLGMVPEYVGQIVVQPNATRVWIAYTSESWTYILLD